NIKLIKSRNNSFECKHNINFINSSFIPKAEKGDIFLLLEQPTDEASFEAINYIDFSRDQDYYSAIFILLEKILGVDEIKVISNEFFAEYQAISGSWEGRDDDAEKSKIQENDVYKVKKTSKKLFIIPLVLILCASFYYIIDTKKIFKDDNTSLLHSDLSLPQEGILLGRSQIISKLKKAFRDTKSINTVALVGVGGSGKSTIARKYAKESGASIIWQINAESRALLVSSMKQIAYAIATQEKEREELDKVLSIKDISERERGLLLFLKEAAKSYPGWLIIYDNVKSFSDIKEFYPYDSSVWGEGSVIITTSNNNIVHNDSILSENVITVGSLNKQEKKNLFISILGENEKKYNIDYDECLNGIPSFPLDVSIAAHYIKETNIRCQQYSQYSSSHNQVFRRAQRNILHDVGEYSKTRYDIIMLPIQYMVEKSSDFRDLLIMISTLSPRDIPKKLLASYKGDIIVDNFIYELKKFSLITKDPHKASGLGQVFSIHRSTQDVVFAYFVNSLQFTENSEQLHNIAMFLENYLSDVLDKHDFLKIQALVPHMEKFLRKADLFDSQDIARLSKKLGVCYFYLGRYGRAKEVFQSTLKMYDQSDNNTQINRAKVLARLGSVYRNVADFEKAKEYLEKALESYKRYYGINHVETAWISTTLGSVYRNIGDYPKAKQLLKNGYDIFVQQYDKDHKKTIWSSSYLGQVYKNVGNYVKAREILEKTLSKYEKEFGSTHTKTAWSLVHLASVYRSIGYPDKAKENLIRAIEIYKLRRGEESFEYSWSRAHLSAVYRDLGNLDEAIDLLQGSLDFYNKNLPQDHVIQGWIKFHLGSTFRHKGDREMAMKLLSESLEINEKHYGKSHIKTAQILNGLGKLGIVCQTFEKSKGYLEKALKVYSIDNHHDRYKVYEALGDLYNEMYRRGDGNRSLMSKSLENFQKAIVVVEKHFPTDSVHIVRIKSKIAHLEI
ncbi:MAG: tetratricopeptide repeat protein, partial [Pseudomonadota bacterium]